MKGNTIAAISTPTGRGGIGVIRISGIDSLNIASKIFQSKTTESIQSHKVYYGIITDKKNNIIDEVLFIYMKAPKSYTAEDIVEIQSHSTPVILRNILDLILNNGAALAEPGEFTKRAFLNGRIDLTQAEAVIDIINAKSKVSLDIALSQIKGDLKNQIEKIILYLENLKAQIEALVDFPDDVEDILNLNEISNEIHKNVIIHLEQLKSNFDDSDIFREGVRIVIAGPPNSGKSSLLNLLLNKDKSIVTSVPGTTRDIIEDFLTIDGIPFVLTDTAGIQQTNDYVEKIGIDKTIKHIEKSDLLVIMFDRVSKISKNDFTTLQNLYETHQDKRIIVVENKIDLKPTTNSNIFLKTDIKISVKNKEGIHSLKKLMTNRIIEDSPDNKDTIVPNSRHLKLLTIVEENCKRIISGINNQLTYDLICIEINESLEQLYEITGKNKKIDVLDKIFNTFCIGK